MTAQTIGPMILRKIPLVVVAASIVLTLAMLLAPSPAHASTTFTVNTPYDTKDGNLQDNHCDVATFIGGDQCTLRAAIEQANATLGADAIRFNIPDSFGAGAKTIHVGSTTPSNGALPDIDEALTINGYTQPGSSPNTLAKGTNAKPMIELDGSALSGGSDGLFVEAPNVVIRGLVVNRFSWGIGAALNSSNTRIEGNFVGTDPSGTKALGNTYDGIAITNTTNVSVGGSSPAARNLVSGNGGSGISLTADGNEVSGNLVGTQRDGKSPLGNAEDGVDIHSTQYQSASGNTVGRSDPAYANTIAFNGWIGVDIYFGDKGGQAAQDNSVLSNSIFSNGLLGIDLGFNVPTPNDPGDADGGPNHRQNHPVLSSAKKGAGKTTIKGKLNSSPNKAYELQFYANPSGAEEGKKLLFSKSVKTDGSGNASFVFATEKRVALGQNVTATATKSATGDTSEFSAPRTVVAS
jgi:CSLREA domain-containing protein